MKNLFFSLVLTLLTISGFATTVTVNATNTGFTTTTTKTAGTMTVSNAANRGYAVFNLSAAGIPAAATITSVKIKFRYTISGTGSPTDRIYGYVGDISSLSAASLYSGAVTANTLYTASWGTRATTKTMSSTAAADTFIKHNYNGTISTTWVESAGSRIYSITGGTNPQLIITYTCTTPTSVSISASSNPICSGSSETFTGNATGATTYSWAGPNSFSSTAKNPAAFTTSTAATGVYTFTATSACGISTVANLTLAVRTVPGTTAGATSLCSGSTTTLTNSGIGGTWTSSSNPRATVNASGVVTGVSTGSVNITYNTGCGSAAVQNMTIITTPAAIAGSATVCVGSTTTLTDATSGGTWSSSDNAVATVNSSTGVVTGVSQGAVTITYANSCGSVTKSMNAFNAPASITGSSTICVGATTTLSNAVSGGTWSASPASKITIDATTGVLTGVGTGGSPSVTYTTGCGSSATLSITVNASPAAISGAAFVCSGSTTTYTDATTLGTWSTSDNAVATITAVGVARGVAVGNVTISYTKSGCSAIKAITVRTTPGSISGASNICNTTTATMTNGTASGTWTSSATGVATVVAATGVVTGVSVGSATITYATGCGSNATKGISVIVTPAAITGTTGVCQSATTTLSDATGGGTWSSSDNAIATVTSGGVVTGVAQGSVTISYAISSCFSTVTSLVTGIPASITGTTGICNGATTTLANTTVSGTWSSSNTSVATINAAGFVTSVGAGTTNITYTTGCGSAAVTAVNVGLVPTTITGASSLCSGAANSTTLTADITGGSWSSSNSAVATVNSSTGVVTGVTDGTVNISYTLTNGCGTTVLSQSVASSLTGKWLGTSSTDWTDTDNWPCGIIPDATIDALIPSGTTFLPDFSAATFTVNNFTVASGTNISISADGIIDVKGSFTNNGIVDGDGYVNLSNASTAQTMYGIGKISNLTLNNSHGASVNSGDTVKVTGDLTLTSGTLNSNGGIRLISTAAATGRVATIGSGNITGDVAVEQYFQGGRRAYRFIAHPFNSFITLSQITPYIDVTGQGGATNGFTSTATNNPSAYWYNSVQGNSSLAYDNGWRAFTSASATADTNKIFPGQGIRVYYRGAKGEGLGLSAYTPSATTMCMYGQLNTGTQNITLHKGTNTDYNMVGNPFASPVNIGNAIAAANTAGRIAGSAFYVWNPFLGVAGGFEPKPVGMSYVLDQNSSFQVRAASEGSVLSITESDKAENGEESLLRTAAPQFVTLNIVDGSNHPWDATYISFNNKAGNSADNKYDATKVSNPDLNFYSLSSDNTKLSIDARPYAAGTTIALGFNTTYAQQYTIKASSVVLPEGGRLFLHDKYSNSYTALTEGTSYSFTVTNDAATQGEKRFELTTEPAAADVKAAASVTVSMTPNPATDQVTISYTASAKAATSINITSVSGVSVMSRDLGTDASGKVTVSLNELPSGIYMVEITNGNEKKVQRLIKE